MNATVLAVTRAGIGVQLVSSKIAHGLVRNLGLDDVAAADGARVCITLSTNNEGRGCTTLEDLCVPPPGAPAGTCNVALYDTSIRCCPTSTAQLGGTTRSPPPRSPPPPPSPPTDCPPQPGYTLLPDTNWEGMPGWTGGQEDGGEAAHALCDADPACTHWNNWGYWITGPAKTYFEYGALCVYVKAGKEMFATKTTDYYCGYSTTAAAATYVTASDAPLAALMPPAAVSGRAGFILEQLYTSYLHGWSSNFTGPLHGGYAGGSGATSVDLADRRGGNKIVAVRTCCAGGSWGNGAQTVQFKTARGKVLYAGSSTVCSTPQEWVPVPVGYRFAGVRTQTKAGSSENYVHRIAFVVASIKPKTY
ncbi:hypothetical protein HXX76_012611 [Chlamydomonas incerta]|uniref:Pherophorin domain-containing protein n=1 Tax=Chlamydomonas incerta TaxID=51695 RepID=A0A835SV00_CHLIN|nr:hypothetical protein HXX76_012611 [Chlamydomonas incerta]|eukprot:KAG2427100.1 hypothetical protein HXX76_012611 [Chlamydomonas incerta]